MYTRIRILQLLIELLCFHHWEYVETPFGIYECCRRCGKHKKSKIY